MRTEYRVEAEEEVGVVGVGKGGGSSPAQPQGQQQGAGNVLGFEPPLGMISGGMGTGADLIAQGIQEIIGSRIYETWLLRNIHRVDASSAMRMIDTYMASDGATPPVFNVKTTTPMKLKVPYSVNEDVARVVAEDASLAETSATFAQYSPSFVTFRTKQVVSNELLNDAKIREILGYQFAENIAESLQAYVLTQIGSAVAATARHHRNPTGGSVGTTTGIPSLDILEALVSSTPIAAGWTTATAGGIAAETPLFKQVERRNLMIASHPAAVSTFLSSLNATASGVASASHSIVSALNRDPGVVTTVLGIPWYTDESLPKPSVAGATSATTPHILIFNPLQVLLAIKSPVRVYLDTESGMASNQTTVHATFRAAGSMLNPKSVAAYSLKTLTA